MSKVKTSFEHLYVVQYLLKWTLRVIPVALIVGTLVAFFLWHLDKATEFRWRHPWMLWLLPVIGVGIHFLYKLLGKNAEAGNDLILEEIHQPADGIPARMTPLVFLTTIATHLFGGSAGREGTAVQMGGSMAAALGRSFGLQREDMRTLLMTGIAAGFGAVFGTPVTGAIFALEVLIIGKIKFDALIPCFIASVSADIVCTAWGIHHVTYHITSAAQGIHSALIQADFRLLLKALLAGAIFGLASFLFSSLLRLVKSTSSRYVHISWLRPVIGGLAIIALTYICGTTDYLGLGVVSQQANGVSIVNAFAPGGAGDWSWLLKIVFTAITLGTGFKGGEVTPLFFIGATLGHMLAGILHTPVDLFAGLGFIAVFAGATNTPIACVLMGVELFGGEYILYYAAACFTAYYFSGHAGIYHAQRLEVPKHDFYSRNEKKLN